MRKEDRLTTITVQEEGINDEAEQFVNKKRAEVEHVGDYNHVALKHNLSMTIYAQIKAFLKAQEESPEYIDWICLGNHGIGFATKKHSLGHLAKVILPARRMNILFVPHIWVE